MFPTDMLCSIIKVQNLTYQGKLESLRVADVYGTSHI